MEEWRWYIESDHAAMMAEMKTSLGLTFNRHFLFLINKETASDAICENTGFKLIKSSKLLNYFVSITMSCSKTLCKMFLDLFLKNCLEISSKTLKHIMYLQNCNHTFFVTVLWCNENLKILTKTEMIGNRKEMKKKNFGRSKVYKMYIYWKKRKY